MDSNWLHLNQTFLFETTNPGIKTPGFFVGLNTHIMKYVYESPDGGHTIYRRAIGQAERTLHKVDEFARKKTRDLEENELWKNIRQASDTNPALRSAMDQVLVIYELSRSDQS